MARHVAGGRPWRRSYHAEILLASFSSLVIEISYTRIISYKLFYYYVYLIIGLALLGVGTGGVVVAISRRLRRASVDSVLFWSFSFGALATIVAYLVVAFTRLETLAVWRYGSFASTKSFIMLVVMCLCVFSSFVAPGIIAATLFGRRPEGIGGLYFADLLGAGAACALVVYLVSSIGAPATVMFAAATMALGALWLAPRIGLSFTGISAALLALAVVLTAAPGLLPAQRLDSSKTPIQGTPLVSKWGPVFHVGLGRAPGIPDLLNLYHDGILAAGIYRWNGKRSFLRRYDFPQDPRSIPFAVLGASPEREAIIGAAGGHEVLASIYYGAKHIDAVELDPVTVKLVTTTYANFDGHLAQAPGVHYINADGRSFIARTSKHYKLIWYPAPDSYAATNGALASAFVLSESYLYTTNALVANLEHLSPGGIFVAQFGEFSLDLRAARFVATARQALAELGVKDPRDHMLVALTQTHFLGNIPLSTIIISRGTLTKGAVRRFLASVHQVPETTVLYAPNVRVRTNPVQSIVRTPGNKLAAFYASYPYNITPTTDNDPYFWHFVRFGTVVDQYTQPLSSINREVAVGERVLVLLLGLSILLSAVFLLLPFATIRTVWRRLPRKFLSGTFFASVGIGFMFFEVTLMQLWNLFLGYPTYSLTVVLASLLIFTGVGAILSGRVKEPRTVLPLAFVGIATLTIFYLLGLKPLTNALLDVALAGRIVTVFIAMAPLGICFGLFMPLGLRRIANLGEHPAQYVAWGWAVNGFASVVGSALATILAMSFGFDFVLNLGLVAYAVGMAAWFAIGGLPLGRRRASASLDVT